MDIEQQLARDEGRRLFAYPDTKGWLTIGIGHNLRIKDMAQVPPQFQHGISDAQCDSLFAADLSHVFSLLDVYLPWWRTIGPSTDARVGVLLNMAFNLGTVGLSHFHEFLAFVKAHDWESAAADLERTPWYHQVGERSARLCRQLREGQWV